MFADDTTLYDADMYLNILLNRFLSKIKPLLDWSFFNKLDCFYCCLYRLFKFKSDEIIYYESTPNEEEKVMNDLYNKLQSYNLFKFQTRVSPKLLTFYHSIKLTELTNEP